MTCAKVSAHYFFIYFWKQLFWNKSYYTQYWAKNFNQTPLSYRGPMHCEFPILILKAVSVLFKTIPICLAASDRFTKLNTIMFLAKHYCITLFSFVQRQFQGHLTGGSYSKIFIKYQYTHGHNKFRMEVKDCKPHHMM